MTEIIRFDHNSLISNDAAPGEILSRSTAIGWNSLLLELFRCDVGGGEFETGATTDHRISLLITGELDVDTLHEGLWKRVSLRPGSALLVPGGQAQRLRWSSRRQRLRTEILHIFLPRQLVRDAAMSNGLPEREAPGWPEQALIRDQVVATVGSSLLKAMSERAPDTYAETAARWLAAHIASMRDPWTMGDRSVLTDVTDDPGLSRAVEFMSANLGRRLTLELLAREAGMSRFHFSRRFKVRTGLTPFAFLLALRLEAGRRMLATTDEPVNRIANACGYERGSHFGTAFVRMFGETPTAFRRRARNA
ncbi:helix-turn-helix domain-containing protein [Sphingomonas floccifaciens]|uniref:Helix-turn-helix domain-containing protein n=1 Tax=Sphingomonas floccifaciens TaxID=1844115 RepID=A0ABW4NE59_9SPHN